MLRSRQTLGPDPNMVPRQRAVTCVVIFAILCGIGAYLAEKSAYRTTLTTARTEAFEELNLLRVRIESSLWADINLVRGLVGYVRGNPDLDQATYSRVASQVVEGVSGGFRNIALARNLVISHVFPMAGNEAALGVDYRNLPNQWEQVQRSINENTIVMSGPVNLVQGGVGIIARFPIFISDPASDAQRLWGIAATVVDFNVFLDAVAINTVAEDFDLRLVGRHGQGTNGEAFWHSSDRYPEEPVRLKISLSSGYWVLEGTPIGGWPSHSATLGLILIIASSIFIAVSFAALAYYRFETRLRQTNRELAAARDDAQRHSRAKSDFLASMSHELRTPLNAIIGFSEMIEGEVLGQLKVPTYKEYAEHIGSSGRHLLQIINDVLDLSKIEAGRADVDIRYVELIPIVTQCIKLVSQDVGTDHPKFSHEIDRDAAMIHCDPRFVRQILLNLLSNADKYTSPTGSVVVSSQRSSSGDICIRVNDNGVGIPAHDLKRVLEPFGQSRRHAHHAHEGTGLGLALACNLMTLQGGTLSIASAVGEGTTVTLLFPQNGSASSDVSEAQAVPRT